MHMAPADGFPQPGGVLGGGRSTLFQMLQNALQEGGLLVLGATEVLHGLQEDRQCEISEPADGAQQGLGPETGALRLLFGRQVGEIAGERPAQGFGDRLGIHGAGQLPQRILHRGQVAEVDIPEQEAQVPIGAIALVLQVTLRLLRGPKQLPDGLLPVQPALQALLELLFDQGPGGDAGGLFPQPGLSLMFEQGDEEFEDRLGQAGKHGPSRTANRSLRS